jgi:hypothetical protein
MYMKNNEAFDGIRIGRGNRRTEGKLAPMPLSAPHMPHGLKWEHPIGQKGDRQGI